MPPTSKWRRPLDTFEILYQRQFPLAPNGPIGSQRTVLDCAGCMISSLLSAFVCRERNADKKEHQSKETHMDSGHSSWPLSLARHSLSLSFRLQPSARSTSEGKNN